MMIRKIVYDIVSILLRILIVINPAIIAPIAYVTSANEKTNIFSFKQFFTNNGNRVNNSTIRKPKILWEQIP